VFNKVTITDT